MKKQRLLSLSSATGLKMINSLFEVASIYSAAIVMLPDLLVPRLGFSNIFVIIWSRELTTSWS